MADKQLGGVLHHIRKLVAARQSALPDHDLLERFLARRDEGAFAALVEQHGPMVLGVCRRVLGQAQDAEDGCQATFLVLARKAASIRKRQSLGSWLHGVALRVSRKLLADRRRRAAPLAGTDVPQPDITSDITWREVQAVLDEELNRLPGTYRAPLVLCYLEGKTQDEAARQLGWTPGTLRGRLDRGRARLRTRLSCRGLGLPAVLVGAGLVHGTAAAVPATLVVVTARAARLLAAGQSLADGAVSPQVLALVQAVTRSLAAAQWQLGAAILVLGALAVGAALAGRQEPANRPAAELAAAAPVSERAESPAPAAPPARTDRLGDPLPPGALARLGTTRFRHTRYVYEVSFTPDSKHLVTAGDNGTRLWDLATGRELRRFRVPAIYSYSAATSPDGTMLANAGRKGALCLWDLATGKELRQFGDEQDGPWRLRWTPDGRTIVTVPMRDTKTVCLWDVANGQLRHRIKLPVGTIHSVEVAPVSGTVAVTCWTDPVIHLLDPATGQELPPIRGHRREACSVAWSPDGKALASSGNDFTVRLWDVATGRELWKKGDLVGGAELAFSPDGKFLAVDSHATGVPRLWDAATGGELWACQGPNQQSQAFVFSPDSRTLAASPGDEHTPLLWDVATGKRLHFVDGHQKDILFLGFFPDGRQLVSGSSNEEGFLWQTADWGAQQPTGRRLRGIHTVLAPDGEYLVAATMNLDTDGKPYQQLEVRDPSAGTVLRRLRGMPAFVRSVAISGDGKTLVAITGRGEEDPLIHVWDVPAGKQVARFKGENNDQFTAPAISPDGQRLAATTTKGGDIVLFEAATGRQLRRLTGHRQTPGALAFTPDGTGLLSAESWSRTLRLWDPATGQELRQFEGKHGASAAVFAPDGRSFATGGADDPTVRLWEFATGQERRQFAGHTARVHVLAFSPDGSLLASGGDDTTILTWDVTGRYEEPAAELPAAEVEAAWSDLTAEDAARAYAAMCRLMWSRAALSLLKERLRPALELDASRRQAVDRWIAELDHQEFVVRQRATQALADQGEAVEPALRQALAGKPSPEVRRRAEGLLAKLADPSEQLRTRRALEVLEHTQAPEARELLQALSRGWADAWLTREARAAVERLARLSVQDRRE